MWGWIKAWIAKRHDRHNWFPLRVWKRETVTRLDESCGWTVIVGMENGLGQRRLMVVQKPWLKGEPPSPTLMVEANQWVYEARGISIFKLIRTPK